MTKKEKHFLLIKTSSLGDILHTLPVFSACRREGRVTVVCEENFVKMIEASGCSDQIIGFQRGSLVRPADLWNLRRKITELGPFDLVIDFQGTVKSALLVLLATSSIKIGFGFGRAEWPAAILYTDRYTPEMEQFPTNRYYQLARSALPNLPPIEEGLYFPNTNEYVQSPNAVICCPHSRWEQKKLTEQHWREIVKDLIVNGFDPIIISGSQEEFEASKRIATDSTALPLAPLSFTELYHRMQKARGIISIDSAPLALANLTTTPTLGMFGPTKGSIFHKGNLIQGLCPFGIRFAYRCPKMRKGCSAPCSKQIAYKAELRAFIDLLKKQKRDAHEGF